MPSDDSRIIRTLQSHPMTAANFRSMALRRGVAEYSLAGVPAYRLGGRKFASPAFEAGG